MIRAFVALLVVLFALPAAPIAHAHVTELAVLRLTELSLGRYRMVWEMKPNTEQSGDLAPIFPGACTREDDPFGNTIIDCHGEPLLGTLGFEQVGRGQHAALFKIRTLDGATKIYTLTPAQPTAAISAQYCTGSLACLAQLGAAYTALGVAHIAGGVDHLLFVLGLLWIASGRMMLLKLITAFTVAHSITLVAATYGWARVNEPFFEAMIALSIVFVAVEALHKRAGRKTLTLSHPWAVSFGFGLLHGLGFASALTSLGLPDHAVVAALISFNIGVEIGQIAFVLAVLAVVRATRSMRIKIPRATVPLGAYAVGGVGAMWFLQRASVLLSAG